MSGLKKLDFIEREVVKNMIDGLIIAVKDSGVSADMALRALGIKVCGLPKAWPADAKWEKTKMDGANWPVWRCSACKDCYFTEPDNLDKFYFCPKCGANTGGKVE